MENPRWLFVYYKVDQRLHERTRMAAQALCKTLQERENITALSLRRPDVSQTTITWMEMIGPMPGDRAGTIHESLQLLRSNSEHHAAIWAGTVLHEEWFTQI